jgi:opacity protein-like surface antigen
MMPGTLRLSRPTAVVVLIVTVFPSVAMAQAGLAEPAPSARHPSPKKQKQGGFGAREGWYVGIGGGYNSVSDQGFRLAPSQPARSRPLADTVSVRHNAGWGARLNAGYNFGRVWRFGAPKIGFEYAYRQNSVDKFAGAGGNFAGSDGRLEAQSLMVNVLHNFMPESHLGPYIGIGAGYANVKFDDYRFTSRRVTHDSDWVFAYQAMVGMRYDLSPKAGFTLDYRYLHTNHPNIRVNRGSFHTNYIGNAVMLGFQFSP